MSEKLQLLLALHALLADQIEAAKRDLTPEELAHYDERSKQIRALAKRLGHYYPARE